MKLKVRLVMLSIKTVVAFFALSLTQMSAFASNVTLDYFSASPSSVNTGGTGTWTLGLTLNGSHTGEQLSSANLMFNSGDGQTASYSASWPQKNLAVYGWVDNYVKEIVGQNCSTPTFGVRTCTDFYGWINHPVWQLTGYQPSTAAAGESFAYGTSGTYFGSVTGDVSASWQQNDPVYGMVDNWVNVVVGESCTVLVGCSPTYGWVNEPYYGIIGYQLNTYSEYFAIDKGISGGLTTSWQQNDPVYGMVDNWVNIVVGESCTVLVGCSPTYGWVNEPYYGLIGNQLNTNSQTLAVNALTVKDSQLSSVPEPATIALVGVALGGIGFARRMRNG